MSAYLALALALAAVILPDVAYHAAPYAVAALWAVALWSTRRARVLAYHRHRWEHRNCHARPTVSRRVRLAVRRLRSIRLHIDIPTRTA